MKIFLAILLAAFLFWVLWVILALGSVGVENLRKKFAKEGGCCCCSKDKPKA